MRLIDADALREKALSDKDLITWTYEYGDAIPLEWIMSTIDNAPTVEPEKAKESEIIKAYTKGFDTGVETVKNERPQGECEKCDYYTFAKAFINGIVEVMSKNGITTIEELLETLKGGAE